MGGVGVGFDPAAGCLIKQHMTGCQLCVVCEDWKATPLDIYRKDQTMSVKGDFTGTEVKRCHDKEDSLGNAKKFQYKVQSANPITNTRIIINKLWVWLLLFYQTRAAVELDLT